MIFAILEVSWCLSVALGFALTDVWARKRTVCIIPQPPSVHSYPGMKLPTILTIHFNIPVIWLTCVPVAETDMSSYLGHLELHPPDLLSLFYWFLLFSSTKVSSIYPGPLSLFFLNKPDPVAFRQLHEWRQEVLVQKEAILTFNLA